MKKENNRKGLKAMSDRLHDLRQRRPVRVDIVLTIFLLVFLALGATVTVMDETYGGVPYIIRVTIYGVSFLSMIMSLIWLLGFRLRWSAVGTVIGLVFLFLPALLLWYTCTNALPYHFINQDRYNIIFINNYKDATDFERKHYSTKEEVPDYIDADKLSRGVQYYYNALDVNLVLYHVTYTEKGTYSMFPPSTDPKSYKYKPGQLFQLPEAVDYYFEAPSTIKVEKGIFDTNTTVTKTVLTAATYGRE